MLAWLPPSSVTQMVDRNRSRNGRPARGYGGPGGARPSCMSWTATRQAWTSFVGHECRARTDRLRSLLRRSHSRWNVRQYSLLRRSCLPGRPQRKPFRVRILSPCGDSLGRPLQGLPCGLSPARMSERDILAETGTAGNIPSFVGHACRRPSGTIRSFVA